MGRGYSAGNSMLGVRICRPCVHAGEMARGRARAHAETDGWVGRKKEGRA